MSYQGSPGRSRSSAQLRELAEAGAREHSGSEPDRVLAWAAAHFGRRLAVACSMTADTVVAAMASAHLPDVDVLFLQTGYHFPETLRTRAELGRQWPVTVIDVVPRRSVQQQDAEVGPRLYEYDPALCCRLRKVEPLADALSGYEAWVTGVRRSDSTLRARTPVIEWDERHQLVKINPIAAWSDEHLLDWAEKHFVVVNPLLAAGYPSIGCRPCTRAVRPGEDPRAGRWAGIAKTECGIHR